MAKAELGNLTVLYSPPSAANVNCENPRRKPISHRSGPNWAIPSAFSPQPKGFSYTIHNLTPFLHRMYTGRRPFRLARNPHSGAKSKREFSSV